MLGVRYLRRYRVTFDFPNEHIYLVKGKRFADPDRGKMSGFQYLFKPKGIEVAFVDEKSPASVAGIHAKDILVALNGKLVSKLKPGAIHRLLDEEGKPVRVTVGTSRKEAGLPFHAEGVRLRSGLLETCPLFLWERGRG